MSKLTISAGTSSNQTFDMTALGSVDWLAYTGNINPVAKAVARVIALTTIAGTPGTNPYSGAQGPIFNWTDGNGPASGSGQGGVYTLDTPPNTGWSIAVPAGVATQRLRVFAGIYAGNGLRVTASLSDGSSPSVSSSTLVYGGGPDPTVAVYTIDFEAASAGQTLTVLVQAVNGGTLSLQGVALGTPPAVTVPGAPTIGTAVAGSKSASVNGSAPASNGGSAITGYRATSTPGGITGTSTTLPVPVAGLTDGVAYTFTLAAQNSVGYGPESAASNSVTPSSVNNPPVFSGTIPNISGQIGVAITPTDEHGYFQDADTLTYSISPSGAALPSGLSINASTGVISGTVSTAGTTTGIRVRATDTANQTVDSNGFNVVIASGPTQVPYNDPAILFSPYTWDDRGTYKSANAPGAYAKLTFTGTSITAKFDVSALAAASIGAGSYPIVRIVIDGKFVNDVQLSSSVSTAAFGALSAGTHTAEVYFRAIDVGLPDRWSTPVSALRFTGFALDTGATYSAPAARSRKMIFFGDSITEGYFVMGQANPGSNNALQTVAPFLAQAVGCELGQLGYSAQGYQQNGNGGVPALSSSTGPVNLYSSGRSRLVNGLLSPQPDYVCVMHGANGNTDSSGVQAVINMLRAAAPSASIFMLVPAGGFARSAITAAVAAKSADTKLFLIDLGAEYQPGMDSSGNGGQYSNDNGLHPNLLGNAKAATGYAAKVQAAIDGAPATTPPVTTPPTTTARTFSVTLGNANGAAAGRSGLHVNLYDTPNAGTTNTTNADGVLSATAQSTLAAGATGYASVLDPATGEHWNGPVQVV